MELTAENTAIVLDSTADFPEGPERFPNWRVVPLYVRFGDESFRDYVDLAPAEFYARLRAAERLPTTSQPTPEDFLACYRELARYDRVLSLHIADRLSGTLRSAQQAASLLAEDRVRTIDTGTVSAGIALLALAVQRLLERGTTDEEVERLAERHRRELRVVFTVETLEFLARGGRIGRARAWAGELLGVRPILSIVDAEVVPVRRVRGARRALAELERELVGASVDRPTLRVGVVAADRPEREAELRALVQRARPQASIEVATTLGAVVGAHAGPGAAGCFWIEAD